MVGYDTWPESDGRFNGEYEESIGETECRLVYASRCLADRSAVGSSSQRVQVECRYGISSPKSMPQMFCGPSVYIPLQPSKGWPSWIWHASFIVEASLVCTSFHLIAESNLGAEGGVEVVLGSPLYS